jgi:hypothetical protein
MQMGGGGCSADLLWLAKIALLAPGAIERQLVQLNSTFTFVSQQYVLYIVIMDCGKADRRRVGLLEVR